MTECRSSSARTGRCVGSLDAAWRRRARVSALFGALLLLSCLAVQSPPDPVWIPGIYDTADDALLAACSMDGTRDVASPPGAPMQTAVSAASASPQAGAPSRNVAPLQPRAPPAL